MCYSGAVGSSRWIWRLLYVLTACALAACGKDATGGSASSSGPAAGDDSAAGASNDGGTRNADSATTGGATNGQTGDASAGSSDAGAEGENTSSQLPDGGAIDGGDGPRDAGGSAPPTTDAEPDSRVGCRSPTQQGCELCCQPSGADCVLRSWRGEGSSSDVTPWYNVTAFDNAPCPDSCARCAQCTDRDQRDLEALGSRPECDCSQPPGLDPCFSPAGCACYCERHVALSKACPDLAQ